MRDTMAAKSVFAISMPTSVAVYIHGKFSTPLLAPISSRIGRRMYYPARTTKLKTKESNMARTSSACTSTARLRKFTKKVRIVTAGAAGSEKPRLFQSYDDFSASVPLFEISDRVWNFAQRFIG